MEGGQRAVYLSFDIDTLGRRIRPRHRLARAGRTLPREALKIVNGIAQEGIVATEVCEVSPPL